jgi:uncharacterized protein
VLRGHSAWERHRNASRPDPVKRLQRADGHLSHVIEMIAAGRPCAGIAVQLQAVERAVTAAERVLIRDHIDHCLGHGGAGELAAMRALARLL